nr:MAG TPA: hypothetical protein [Caudoviricetes sp.]
MTSCFAEVFGVSLKMSRRFKYFRLIVLYTLILQWCSDSEPLLKCHHRGKPGREQPIEGFTPVAVAGINDCRRDVQRNQNAGEKCFHHD